MPDEAGIQVQDFHVEKVDAMRGLREHRASTNVAVAIAHLKEAVRLGANPEVVSRMIQAIRELEK